MSASLGLFRLQQIDNRIHQIETRLTWIRETLENDAELRDALSQVEIALAGESDLQRELHNSEEQARAQRLKIEQAESSLYGGSVRNPKELQDLQNDVASLKKHLSVLEERQLEFMLEVDAAQKALALARAGLDRVQSRLGDQHRGLLAEQESLLHDQQRFESERQAAVSTIATDMLAIYEQLRQERRGVAVAEVADGGCAACGTTLTPALHQSARQAGQLVRCPSCGRILFAG